MPGTHHPPQPQLSPVVEEHASESNHAPPVDATITDGPSDASLPPDYDSLPDERLSIPYDHHAYSYPPEDCQCEVCRGLTSFGYNSDPRTTSYIYNSDPRTTSYGYYSEPDPPSESRPDWHQKEEIMIARRFTLCAVACLLFQLTVTFLPADDPGEFTFRKSLSTALVFCTFWIPIMGICKWAGADCKDTPWLDNCPFNDHILLLVTCIPPVYCALNLFAPRAVWFPMDLVVLAACAIAFIFGIVLCVRAEIRPAFEPVPTEEV